MRAAFGARVDCVGSLVLREPPSWTRWSLSKDCMKSQPGSSSAACIAEGSSQSRGLTCPECSIVVSYMTW